MFVERQGAALLRKGHAMTTAYTTTVIFETATGPGALDGYVMACSCGARLKTLFKRQAHMDAASHMDWHAKQKPAAAPAVRKLAKRHYCISAANDGYRSQFHTKRDGAPRGKTCTYCRGKLVVQEGLHGVFVWAGDARYPVESAVKTFTSPAAAQKFADKNADKNYVVRWISM